MRIEVSELEEQLKPYRNGCAFRLLVAERGLVLSTGCYNLFGLASGAHRYLNGIIGKEEKMKIPKKYLVESPTVTKNKLLKTYTICKICNR